MLIHLENTYNPNVMKFIIDHVWIDFNWECKDFFNANKSLLARELWKIDGVVYLLFGSEFVLVSKKNDIIWDELSLVIMEVISDYLETHTKVFDDIMSDELNRQMNSKCDLSEFEKKISKVLEEKVQPSLKLHGGFVELVEFCDGVLKVRLQGACNGCYSSEATLQFGIKNLLQYYFPEIQVVENVF